MGLLTFMVPVGFANASSVLIGQYLGAGKPDLVRHYYKLSIYCAVAVAFCMNVLLFMFEGPFITFYTKNQEIGGEISKAWVIFNIFVIFDTT